MPNKLEITLPSDREIRITRAFDAPRNLVWDAHTKPELVRRWLLGPPGWEMPVCRIDLRVGGEYRYEWEDKARNKKMGMGGTYTEVKAPEKIGSAWRMTIATEARLTSPAIVRVTETSLPTS